MAVLFKLPIGELFSSLEADVRGWLISSEPHALRHTSHKIPDSHPSYPLKSWSRVRLPCRTEVEHRGNW